MWRGATIQHSHVPRRCVSLVAPRRPLWQASPWVPSVGMAAPPERDETPWREEKQLCHTDACTNWKVWKSIIIRLYGCRLLVITMIIHLYSHSLCFLSHSTTRLHPVTTARQWSTASVLRARYVWNIQSVWTSVRLWNMFTAWNKIQSTDYREHNL